MRCIEDGSLIGVNKDLWDREGLVGKKMHYRGRRSPGDGIFDCDKLM